MNQELILFLSDPRASLERVGGKGASLARLASAGLPVPDGFFVTTTAYRSFVAENGLENEIFAALKTVDVNNPASLEESSGRIRESFLNSPVPETIEQALLEAYQRLSGAAVAVRSSATAEDLPEASFAGQQDTYLNILGAQAVLEATRSCWASLWTARAIGYRARQGIAPDQVALAVVVQTLVPADAAGILFTAHPLTGDRSRVLVNAAWGLGEAVVGGMVTPDTFLLDKKDGRVISQEIAEKQVMTVRVDGGTVEQPVPDALRRRPALQESELDELLRLSVQIESLYAMPMDIEWAVAGGRTAILQARPITALPEEPQAAAPLEWKLPDPKGQYMRGSVVDFMPGPLTPLFESMIVPAVNTSIYALMRRLAGMPLDMFENYLTTINHYAYLSTRYTPRQLLLVVFRMLPAMPRMIRDGISLWKDEALPHYAEVAAGWDARDPQELSPRDLFAGVNEAMRAAADHLTTLQVSTLGIAAGAEGIFTRLYEKSIRRSEDASAPTFLMGFESTPIRAEKSLYDLAAWCKGRETLAEYVRQSSAAEIVAGLQNELPPHGVDVQDWQDWQSRIQAHLKAFGYAIYDLDFASPLPQDEPAPLIETIKLFLSGQGKDPYQRQQASAGRREAASRAVAGRLKGLKAWGFRKTLGWAQKYGPLREDSIAEIGLGYPVIRKLLLHLGGRFVAAGLLETAEEIYWMKAAEIEEAVRGMENGNLLTGLGVEIRNRRQEWSRMKRFTPPTQLPGKGKILGMDMDAFAGVHSGEQEGSLIRGLGASPGQATGVARVLNGPVDFDQMRPGDVLVAAITTPAWTPLFAMASAVVTDIGGPLSHGSIVAREYGIPAVLGTGVATRRIRSGQVVTVDGSSGTITLQ